METEAISLGATAKALEKNGYKVRIFPDGASAADYIADAVQGRTVGFGDSQTMSDMGLYERLSRRNTVFDPKQAVSGREFTELAKSALTADVFLTSANGVSADGVIVNLDGTGNRAAGSLFGHEKIFFIVGRNKLCGGLDDTIYRVRNVAAPKNAHRLGLRTPCAIRGDRCCDCSSPDRICNGLLIQMKKMHGMEAEVVLIDEDLGF